MSEKKSVVVFLDNDSAQVESWVLRLRHALPCEVEGLTSREGAKEFIRNELERVVSVITDMHFGSQDPHGGLEIVRFCAGIEDRWVPVIVLTGFAEIGNAVQSMELGAFTYVTKGLEDDGTFKVLVKRVEGAVERQRLKIQVQVQGERLQENLRRLEEDLAVARLFQESLLRDTDRVVESWAVNAASRMCDDIGGDFVFSSETRAGELVVALGDVKGHGVGAALVAGMAHAALKAAVELSPEPAYVARRLQESPGFPPPDSFFSLVYGLCCADGRFRYFSAGHLPFLRVSRIALETLESTGPVFIQHLGGGVETRELKMRRGDDLFVFSDGLTEAMNAGGEELGVAGLAGALVEKCRGEFGECFEKVLERIENHRGARHLEDDATLLRVQFR